MKTAIVTGAGGFIGSNMVDELVDNGYYVQAIVRSNNNPPKNNVKYIHLDLNDPHTEELSPADYFFNFAWDGLNGPNRSNKETQLNNVTLSLNAYKLAESLKCKKYIGVGSIMELESSKIIYSDEEYVGDNLIYGFAKMLTHYYCKLYSKSSPTKYVCGRLSNVYGPGDDSPRLINTTIQKVLDGIPPQFTPGDQIYDFIYIKDAVKLFRLIAEKGKKNTTYPVFSGETRTLKEYLETLREELNSNTQFHYGAVPFSGIHLSPEDINIQKTVTELGYIPTTTFKEGIQKTIAWARSDRS